MSAAFGLLPDASSATSASDQPLGKPSRAATVCGSACIQLALSAAEVVAIERARSHLERWPFLRAAAKIRTRGCGRFAAAAGAPRIPINYRPALVNLMAT